MKRPVAMILAGVVTTIAVIGGTVAAVQTGVFASSTTTVQTNGEISVPTSAPATEQSQTTIEVQPTDTQVISETVSDPTETAAPDVVVDTSREAALVARLNEAYALMKQRDDTYQAKLKEAYARLQANQGSSVNRAVNSGSSQPSSALVAPVPAVVISSGQHDDQHPQDQHTEVQHKEDQHTEGQHKQDQHTGDQHPTDQHPTEQHTTEQHTYTQQHTTIQSHTGSDSHSGGRREPGDH